MPEIPATGFNLAVRPQASTDCEADEKHAALLLEKTISGLL
jgi:hypothetical protein